MDEKLKEKPLDNALATKLAMKTSEIVKELFVKDLQYAANILEIPIDEDGVTSCTINEHTKLLALLYGILSDEENKIKKIKNKVLADIEKRNSSAAEDLKKLADSEFS
ncbi:hypothetical protein C3L57_07030 [Veillonellaceae bacterium M2-8]|nr:hypothetical protein [Veillonellaceae bacterium M2-8]